VPATASWAKPAGGGPGELEEGREGGGHLADHGQERVGHAQVNGDPRIRGRDFFMPRQVGRVQPPKPDRGQCG
jgi:hypothetical protein